MYFQLGWYISEHGDDNMECGGNWTDACATLDWTIQRILNTSEQTRQSVSLFTDTQLLFDHYLQVTFIHKMDHMCSYIHVCSVLCKKKYWICCIHSFIDEKDSIFHNQKSKSK